MSRSSCILVSVTPRPFPAAAPACGTATQHSQKRRVSSKTLRVCQRPGFTLTELMVVIAIIGGLASLMLPAIQRSRLEAAKTVSSSHLRQLGLALHRFHDDFGHLPAGYQSDPGRFPAEPEILDAGPGWAWGSALLPYLEQMPLHERLDRNLPCWDPSLQNLVTTPIPVFLNPAADDPSTVCQLRDDSGEVVARFSRTHYVANAGREEPWGVQPPLTSWEAIADGPFYRNSRTPFASITDGLSNTVFLGEHTTISDKTWVGVVPGVFVCPRNPDRFPFTECDAAATLVLVHSGPSASEPGVVHTPSFPTCHVCQMYAPWPGGLVLLGDGSVRFVPTIVNSMTWAAMCGMRDGEVVGE